MAQDVVHLRKSDIPRRWYNIQADLPRPLDPPLHPATRRPVGFDDMRPIFADALIEQEMSTDRWIDVPEEVMEAYAMWRPTPLHRARNLEQAIGSRARIFYKYEGGSPAGSHKPNTAVPQAYYNKRQGIRRLTTETGAGQWGASLSFACQRYGMECTVYMVKASYESKPYRRVLMRLWGGEVFASPSDRTNAGRKVRAELGDTSGSLGIAISEAVEDAVGREDTRYALGSVLNHVLLHQTVIGLELDAQLREAGVEPDVMVGCVGGGSNFGGFAFPMIGQILRGERRRPVRIVAVEPTACPTITQGRYDYDLGDTVGLTPLMKMHTLGHDFVPPAIHSGGLRYHGMAPLVSAVVEAGLAHAVAVDQVDVFEACRTFLNAEGILPAPEAGHAVLGAINEAKRLTAEGRDGNVVFNLCGHGFLDLPAYQAFIEGRLNGAG